jgi:hypothetical protein
MELFVIFAAEITLTPYLCTKWAIFLVQATLNCNVLLILCVAQGNCCVTVMSGVPSVYILSCDGISVLPVNG